MRFRKKPVVINAIQWTGDNLAMVAQWAALLDFEGRPRDALPTGDHTIELPIDFVTGSRVIEIRTPEGVMTANPGDWVIRGIKGEFYPCKPDIFELTYEAVP